jgi:hypothetical protein
MSAKTVQHYSARIGESCPIAEQLPYEALLCRIMEFTIRAALARSVDESEWEHEELRRKGLRALQIFRAGKAVWADEADYQEQLSETRREGDTRFERTNESDPALYERLDTDLRARWRCVGYETPSLISDMKKLFAEIERDATERAQGAREGLVAELLKNE